MRTRKSVLLSCVAVWIGLWLATSYAAEVRVRGTTLDEVKKALRSESPEAIVRAMNDIKRDSSPELVAFAFDLWTGKESQYSDLAWRTIRSPRVRAELANVLVQADSNGMIKVDREEMRAFARGILKGPHEDAKRTAILTLGLLNNRGDVALLSDVAAQENPETFRAAVIALAKICDPSAQVALNALRGRVRNTESKRFLETPVSELVPYRRCG